MNVDKSALLAALKPKTQNIEVEGFGQVTLKQLTIAEADALRVKLDKDDKSSEFGLSMLGASMIDDEGQRLFSDEELASLRASSGTKIEELVDAVLILNNYKKAQPEKK